MWLVRTPNGFLGHRRFSHKEGTTHAKDTKFEHARLFSRYQDAAAYEGDVVTATVTLD